MRRLQQRDIDDLFKIAARGGKGRATALTDCIAEGPDQLMYMEGDDIVILREFGDDLLAFCEGEVGWMKRSNIRPDGGLASSSTSSSLSSFGYLEASSDSVGRQDMHNAQSTPSNSIASGCPPYTPSSPQSSSSARSSQSTNKSHPTTPHVLSDIFSPGSDAHEPMISPTLESSSSNTQWPRVGGGMPGKSGALFPVALDSEHHPSMTGPAILVRRISSEDLNRPLLAPAAGSCSTPSFASPIPTPEKPARSPARAGTLASPVLEVSGSTLKKLSSDHTLLKSPLSDDAKGRLSGPVLAGFDVRSSGGELRPTINQRNLATISSPLLGVRNPSDISKATVSDAAERSRNDSSRSHSVRHIDRRAGNLVVLTEVPRRQSFEAETARLSNVSLDWSIDDGAQEYSQSNGLISASETGSAIPASQRHSEDITKAAPWYSNGSDLSQDANDADYPRTPGTFGVGRSPDDASTPALTASPVHFTKQHLPTRSPKSSENGSSKYATYVRRPPLSNETFDGQTTSDSTRRTPEGINEVPRTVDVERVNDLRLHATHISTGSHWDYDWTSLPQPGPEAILSVTPPSMLTATFRTTPRDEPATYLGGAAEGTLEATGNSLGYSPATESHNGPSASSFPSSTPMIGSPSPMNFRWSLESRAAAKMAMRDGFYALGHSPQLTESQQNDLRELSAHSPSERSIFSDTAEQSAQAPSPVVPANSLVPSDIEPPVLSRGRQSQASRPSPVPTSNLVSVPWRVRETSTSTRPTAASETVVDARSVQSSVHPVRSPPVYRDILPRHTLDGDVFRDDSVALQSKLSHSSPGGKSSPSAASALGLHRAIGYPVCQSTATGSEIPHNTSDSNDSRTRLMTTVASFGVDGDVLVPSTDPSLNQQLPEQRLRGRLTSPTNASSEDNHSSSSHTNELDRSMLPTRTASTDDHHLSRLVSLPSELFQTHRDSPVKVSPSLTASPQTLFEPLRTKHSPAPGPATPLSHRSFSSPYRPSRFNASGSPSVQISPLPEPSQTPTSDNPSLASLQRGRTRSFSAALSKSLGKSLRKQGTPAIESPVPPVSHTDARDLQSDVEDHIGKRPRPGFLRHRGSQSSITSDHGKTSFDSTWSAQHSVPNESSLSISLPWTPQSRNVSSSKLSPTQLKSSLRAPVSHRDYADPTVNADGMEFEMIQTKKVASETPSVSLSFDQDDLGLLPAESHKELEHDRPAIPHSPPEVDEWGFLRRLSPTPEIFQSRQLPGDVRAAEQKWLNIIAQPLGRGQTPGKKVRRLVIEQGIPASLRGRVWEWFMSSGMSGRVEGLFNRLLSDEPTAYDDMIDRDVVSVYSDHAAFHCKNSSGQEDLRALLRAYVHFAPSGYRTDIARLAGALLIHAVLEDAFWLLSGIFNGILKAYYVKDTQAFMVDLNVFGGILEGSEPRIGQLFRSLGILPEHYLVKWWTSLFIRSLPWPTVLRFLDAVISEGPRYLMIAALAVITLSRDRLLQLPRTKAAIVDYLQHLPQDGLLLPDTFMRACDQVKLRDDDLRKLRISVSAQMSAHNQK